MSDETVSIPFVLAHSYGEDAWVPESFAEGDWPRFLELVARKVPKAHPDA